MRKMILKMHQYTFYKSHSIFRILKPLKMISGDRRFISEWVDIQHRYEQPWRESNKPFIAMMVGIKYTNYISRICNYHTVLSTS